MNAPSDAKIKGLWRLIGDGFGKAGDFNCLKTVKADLVPRRHTELTLGKVIRPSLDPAKPTLAFGIRGTAKMHFVKALLGKCSAPFET